MFFNQFEAKFLASDKKTFKDNLKEVEKKLKTQQDQDQEEKDEQILQMTESKKIFPK